MTAKLTPHTRLLAIAGLVLAVAVAAMMVMRSGVTDSSSTGERATPATASRSSIATHPAKATRKHATAPKPIVILPGVPSRVGRALQHSRVVVAVVSGGGPTDHAQAVEARAGAKRAGAAFVQLDVRKEAPARSVASFAGTDGSARILVVRRPGKVVNRFRTLADRAIVAQAAVNAGARPKK
jgi:hypothetical protein